MTEDGRQAVPGACVKMSTRLTHPYARVCPLRESMACVRACVRARARARACMTHPDAKISRNLKHCLQALAALKSHCENQLLLAQSPPGRPGLLSETAESIQPPIYSAHSQARPEMALVSDKCCTPGSHDALSQGSEFGHQGLLPVKQRLHSPTRPHLVEATAPPNAIACLTSRQQDDIACSPTSSQHADAAPQDATPGDGSSAKIAQVTAQLGTFSSSTCQKDVLADATEHLADGTAQMQPSVSSQCPGLSSTSSSPRQCPHLFSSSTSAASSSSAAASQSLAFPAGVSISVVIPL